MQMSIHQGTPQNVHLLRGLHVQPLVHNCFNFKLPLGGRTLMHDVAEIETKVVQPGNFVTWMMALLIFNMTLLLNISERVMFIMERKLTP